MPGAIIGFDLGSKLGYAIKRADGRVESGSADFTPSAKEGYGMRFLRFRAWLHDLKVRLGAAGEDITLVRYERVDFMVQAQVYSAQVWGGNAATLTAWCEHHRIPYEGINVSTIKKAITGNGRASKSDIAAAVRKLGFPSASTDEADAIAVLLTPSRMAA